MKRQEFEKLVSEGVSLIPKKFLDKLENVAIVVEDEPTAEQIGKNRENDTVLLGLYEGIPQTERGSGYLFVLPDKITIFKKAIESMADSDDEIRQIIKETVWHEIAHHFGSDEYGAESAEKKAK